MAKICEDATHNYQPVNETVGVERRTNAGGDTEVYLSYVCTQCGNAIQCFVARWPKRNKEDGKF
jgi:hypothetical protein